MLAWGIAERVDDYCATAYVYCTRAQAVPRCNTAAAVADIERKPYESAAPFLHSLVGGEIAPRLTRVAAASSRSSGPSIAGSAARSPMLRCPEAMERSSLIALTSEHRAGDHE